MTDLTREQLAERLGEHRWYHDIDLGDGLRTSPASEYEVIRPIWGFIERELGAERFDGERVLDVGCRDGRWSFEAERRGATEVIGIDNDLSRGAVELLIPYLRSNVQMHETSLYDVTPETFGRFDTIFLFGVLYHLRYPFWGLQRLVDCVKPGGRLLLESGMLITPEYRNERLLYCPVKSSPYEATSCTFFNRTGLETTMRSMGMRLVRGSTMAGSECGSEGSASRVAREFFVFVKEDTASVAPGTTQYWRSTHLGHSTDHPRHREP